MAMAATRTAEKIRERKLNRMRLGQAVANVHNLLSDPEIQVALVPLTEAEYLQCIESTAHRNIPDNISGAGMRDRLNTSEILVRSVREPKDLSQRMFDDIDEMTEVLEVNDINFLQDMYFEMAEQSSPSLDGVPPEELEALKKALQEMDWSELSGRQWYALKRFLFSTMPELLQGNSLGSFLTSNAITSSEEEKFTPTVSQNSNERIVKSAENP